ncbi:MAG: shikimate kinase [Eubacterium sp.]|nr:shikimate kinase [Eubacterium sp.]
MNNIYLIGFMGSGKTSVGKYLARVNEYPFIETDKEIEADCGMTIPEIFNTRGEEYFREKESMLLLKAAGRDNAVVSCGGGVPLRKRNVEIMKKTGTIVYLTAEPKTIYERIKNERHRPLLEGKMNPEEIRRMMMIREEDYEAAADLTIRTDGKTIMDIGEEIFRIFQNK